MTAPLVEFVNATCVKGDTRAVDGLSLTIREGEHTAILGPNGAGKTTLLNLLTFEDRPLAPLGVPASVRVLGRDNWPVFELRAMIGIVSNNLHGRFVAGHSSGPISGEDAVVSGFFATHGMLLYVDVTDAMRDAAREALARVDASHLATKTLNEMSTGEARRVLIARALVRRPRALVLDEPTTGLDIVARQRFLETVRRVAREGTTVILITHHVEEIIPEIDRVVLLDRGRVAAAGPKHEMLTAARLTTLFGAPVSVSTNNGYFVAHA
ncbi:MAG: ATP-binding cassette domain-containing protein [Acidobacteria bacterium]|nr:ATP-binding cassette domain-containing protein [Acidobacteriota bacterium]